MQSKLSNIESLTGAVSGPVNIDIDVTNVHDLAIGVTYDAGGAGDLELHASIDGTNFSQITDSVQAVDIAGGTHIWNISDCFFPFMRIVVPAVAVLGATLVRNRLLRSE